MSDQYIGEIRLAGFTFAPVNWALCDGSLLPISEFETLFTLIGTTYGGDGVNTFGLPDLRGCIPIHQGTSITGNTYVLGQRAGTESVTLTSPQLALHTHSILVGNANGTGPLPRSLTFAGNAAVSPYEPSSTGGASGPLLAPQNGNLSHENRMPCLTVNYIIAVYGIFPSPS